MPGAVKTSQGHGRVPGRLPGRTRLCPEYHSTGRTTPIRREQLLKKNGEGTDLVMSAGTVVKQNLDPAGHVVALRYPRLDLAWLPSLGERSCGHPRIRKPRREEETRFSADRRCELKDLRTSMHRETRETATR